MSDEILADSSERSMDAEIRDLEPASKRQKIESVVVKASAKPQDEKLEQRLGGILCCAVCLDLPKAAVYQVKCGSIYPIRAKCVYGKYGGGVIYAGKNCS